MQHRRWLALLVVLVLALSACGGDDDDDALDTGTDDTAQDDGDGDEAEGGEEIEIVATDYAFDAPAELTGGVVTITLDNQGDQLHEAGFLQVDGGTSPEELVEAFTSVFEGGPFPDTWQAHTGVAEVEGGESVTTTIELPEGDWILYCALQDEPEGGGGEGEDGPPPEEAAEGQPSDEGEGGEGGEGGEEQAPMHIELGMYEEVSVSGDTGSELPDGPSIVARDYEFETSGLEAGDQTVTFLNEGPEQWHHVVLFEFEEGVDEAGAREAFEAFAAAEQSGSPPPEGTPEPRDLAGSYVMSPDLAGTFDVTFQSGRTYAALCFISDLEGGPPHAFAHDMMEIFTVE